MPVYMVERHLPGMTKDQFEGAKKAALEAGKKMATQGKQVRYIRSTYVPGDGKCMCLFEAASPDLVKKLNEEAKLPFSRVVEAQDLA